LKERSDRFAREQEKETRQKEGAHRSVGLDVWATDAPPAQIPYNVVRHATGKYGRAKISALEITQEGDTVVVRPVNSRNRPLQTVIELPCLPEVLRTVARVLEQL
jgi:hypothetical protein